jgi:hypothetical protein
MSGYDAEPLSPSSAPEPEKGSVVSRLRELRENFATDVTVDLEVPGYRGELVARYGALPWDVIRNLALRGERGKRNPDIAPTLAADGLANAVVGFFTREGDGEKQPLTWQGDPVTDFGPALRSVLGIEAETVRETVKAVFPDEFALVSHYAELMEWQSERDDGDEGLAEAAASDDAVHPTSN